jgi:hypothetical protein
MNIQARRQRRQMSFDPFGKYSSGANIHELAQPDAEAALEFAKHGQELFQTITDADRFLSPPPTANAWLVVMTIAPESPCPMSSAI